MANSAKTPESKVKTPFDERFTKEESRVRARRSGTEVRREREMVRPPPPGEDEDLYRESIAERTARIDGKVRAASGVLSTLPPTDPRARLLSSAILRRDEVLLDAIVRAEEAKQKGDLIVDLPTLAPRARRTRE